MNELAERLLSRAQTFVDARVLGHAELFAVAWVAPRFGEDDLDVLLALAFVAHAPRGGDTAVDLTSLRASVEEALDEQRATRAQGAAHPVDRSHASGNTDLAITLAWPDDPSTWERRVLASPMVGRPDDDGHRPFVASVVTVGAHTRTLVQTRRLFLEEERVAQELVRRAHAAPPTTAERERLEAVVARLFAGDEASEAARAVRLAALGRVAVVSGGPGTGKTYSVSRLLAALLVASDPGRPLAIALAAPTGKAAVRMRDAIREAVSERLDVPDAVRAALLALEATTLHRLIGLRPDGSARHDRHQPIEADVVVIDEASMVDIALLRRVLDALAPEARLVLLGDRDQLASVDAGAALADLVRGRDGGGLATAPLASRIQAFTVSRRFASAPHIALTAACLQSEAAPRDGLPETHDARLERAIELLTGRGLPERAELSPAERIVWLGAGADRPSGARARPSPAQLDALASPYLRGSLDLGSLDALRRGGLEGPPAPLEGYVRRLARHLDASRGPRRRPWLDSLLEQATQRSLLDALDHYRVLATHREGPLGVEGLERAIAARVRAFLARRGVDTRGAHWLGRPILITENAYDVDLMNGDVGLVLPTPRGLEVAFPSDRAGQVRTVPIARLPSHEGALAMTVHKSQGSQFDRVALVLAGRTSPIQTRELVYTAITRAKQQLLWLGDEGELRAALVRRAERITLLAERLAARAGAEAKK